MRFVALLAVVLGAGVALGDAAPPSGMRYIRVENTITLHRSLRDYDIYACPARGTLKKVAIEPGEPRSLDLGPGRREATLFVVPKSVSKRYLLTKELAADLDVEKKPLPKGVAKFELRTSETVPASDKRKLIRQGYLIKPGDENEPPRIEELPPEPITDKEPTASAPRQAVVGLSLALAAVSAGVWYSQRRTR